MDKEENKEDLAKALHGGKLPSLRTYQGDVASFIQSKDKSVAQIALKSKEEKAERRKQEEEGKRKNFFAPIQTTAEIKEEHKKEEEKVEEQRREVREEESRPEGSRSPTVLISILGLVLLVASVGVGVYIFASRLKDQPIDSEEYVSVIRSDHTISIDGGSLTPKVFEGSVLSAKSNAEYVKGVTTFETSRTSVASFLQKLEWTIPASLTRSLSPEFAVGLWGSGTAAQPEFFIILRTKDYGIAFRDLLAWEDGMDSDLGSLIGGTTIDTEWKDLIIKNKDTRALVNPAGNVVLVYTFINQNTILITESEAALTSLVNSYVAGNTVR